MFRAVTMPRRNDGFALSELAFSSKPTNKHRAAEEKFHQLKAVLSRNAPSSEMPTHCGAVARKEGIENGFEVRYEAAT